MNGSNSTQNIAKTAAVTVNSSVVGTISRTGASGNYSAGRLNFVAASTSSTISFAGGPTGSTGVVFDSIGVIATPAPAGALIALAGLPLLGLARRRFPMA